MTDKADSTLSTALELLSKCDSSDGKVHTITLTETAKSDSPYLTITYSNGYYLVAGTGIASERWSECPTQERLTFLAKFKINLICPMFG